MKKTLSILFTALMLAGSSVTALAALPEKDVVQNVQKKYPALGIKKAVYLSEVNLYELQAPRPNMVTQLYYTDENLDFFLLSGTKAVNPKTGKEIIAERNRLNTQAFFNNLPFDKAIKVVYGKGTRKLVVFTDPDCPYCQASDKIIHSQLTNDDITIYYFMNPLTLIPGHENANHIAKVIWCAPNRSEAWKAWMVNHQLPNNDGTCKTPVDETRAIAEANNFNATPLFIFDNGMVRNIGIQAADDIRNTFKMAPVK